MENKRKLIGYLCLEMYFPTKRELDKYIETNQINPKVIPLFSKEDLEDAFDDGQNSMYSAGEVFKNYDFVDYFKKNYDF